MAGGSQNKFRVKMSKYLLDTPKEFCYNNSEPWRILGILKFVSYKSISINKYFPNKPCNTHGTLIVQEKSKDPYETKANSLTIGFCA